MLIASPLPKHILSKSTFMRGCQCEKSLWLYKHMPELRDAQDDAQQSIFNTGTNVGLLARQLFPGGVDATPATAYEYQQSVIDTAKYIQEGRTIIYEAAFQFEGVLAALDILVNENGKWVGYEVKSTTGVKEPHIKDAALQYWVITSAGIHLTDIYIVHLDNTYVRKGALNIHRLFARQSVLKEVVGLQPFISEKVPALKSLAMEGEMPTFDIGSHCSDPYDCDFTGYCWKHIPSDSVFDLRGRGGSETAFQLYRKGILTIDDIPGDFELKPSQVTQVRVHKSGNIEYQKEGIDEFLQQLQYPLYFLDFETFNSAVPDFDHCKPYQQIPFQFSLHIQSGAIKQSTPLEKHQFEHKCFLAEPGIDPRLAFIETLIGYLGKKGSVIVYNQSFENSRLNDLAKLFPRYAHKIKHIQQRMVDLMAPFRSKFYYVAAMKGSYSIKEVLPALVPELNYDSLEINNGSSASEAFYNLQFEKDGERVREIRRQLEEYCEMDTWAMVKVLEKLNTII